MFYDKGYMTEAQRILLLQTSRLKYATSNNHWWYFNEIEAISLT